VGAATPATNPPSPAATAAAPAATPVKPPVPPPEVAEKPLPQPLEGMKRLMDSFQETDLGKVINRWMKSPPPDQGPRRSEPSPTQTR
jgi:hypothetical protein